MANPQKENGFTQIANEILEALAGIRISGEARQCLDVIIRKTYGFQKKADNIALSQFVLLTKMPKSTVCRALKKLIEMNLIVDKNDNDNGNSYRFNKDFDKWKPLTKKIIVDKNDNSRWQKRQSALTKMGNTKETITKETITKETATQKSVADINKIFNIFYKTVNPAIKWEDKTQRKEALWLINKYGLDAAAKYAQYACSIQGKDYAPVITTPYQLRKKLGELKIYWEKSKTNKSKSPLVYKTGEGIINNEIL